MISKHYMKNRLSDGREGLFDSDNVAPYDFRTGWTEKIATHKRERILALRQIIAGIRTDLELFQDGDEHKRRMLVLYLEECLMDLREDEALLEHNGNIPPVLDGRMKKKCALTYNRLRLEWGLTEFDKVKEDADVELRGDVIIKKEKQTFSVGGGKA